METAPNSSLDVLRQTEQCVVCGDTADGFHYGVRSCRGCNAFFRRAVTYDMQFTCRRGGKCPVDKNARCACRACRLAKCVAVGMDKKAVQPKRESTTGGTPAGVEGDVNRSVKCELDIRSPGSAIDQPHSNASLSNDLFMPALPPSPPPDCGIIARQCFDYIDQKRRRRAMLCNSLAEILAEDCETGVRRVACADDYSSLFQVQMVLMFEWAEKLAEFRSLMDPLDKTKLLRAFALRYLLLDNVFHTMELGYSDRLVLVNNTYMKPGEWPPFDPGETNDANRVKLLMFGQETLDLLNEVVIPMFRMGLTAGEMMTLRMIMFWNPGSVGLSAQGLTVAQEASNVAVKELHHYFESEGITDIEHRIGNLLLLLPSFTKHVQYLYETVKLIPSFGQMNEWDAFMDDLLKGF